MGLWFGSEIQIIAVRFFHSQLKLHTDGFSILWGSFGEDVWKKFDHSYMFSVTPNI